MRKMIQSITPHYFVNKYVKWRDTNWKALLHTQIKLSGKLNDVSTIEKQFYSSTYTHIKERENRFEY